MDDQTNDNEQVEEIELPELLAEVEDEIPEINRLDPDEEEAEESEEEPAEEEPISQAEEWSTDEIAENAATWLRENGYAVNKANIKEVLDNQQQSQPEVQRNDRGELLDEDGDVVTKDGRKLSDLDYYEGLQYAEDRAFERMQSHLQESQELPQLRERVIESAAKFYPDAGEGHRQILKELTEPLNAAGLRVLSETDHQILADMAYGRAYREGKIGEVASPKKPALKLSSGGAAGVSNVPSGASSGRQLTQAETRDAQGFAEAMREAGCSEKEIKTMINESFKEGRVS